MMAGSTISPSCTSVLSGQCSSSAGYAGCSSGRVPIGFIVFTGGRYPRNRDRTEVGRAAHLTALDEDAAAGSGGRLVRVRNLGHRASVCSCETELRYHATVLEIPVSRVVTA